MNIYVVLSLNPYSTGCWFAGYLIESGIDSIVQVLILILLDVGLLDESTTGVQNEFLKVLILILLDVGLLVPNFVLNALLRKYVLILILLDVGLLGYSFFHNGEVVLS